MGKRQTDLLKLWAAYGLSASAYEVLGAGRSEETDGAIHALTSAGLLERVDGGDAYGGTRLRPTDAGYAAIGQTPPTKRGVQQPKDVSGRVGRPVPSLN